MLRAVFFTVAIAFFLAPGAVSPATANDSFDVFEADEAPDAALKRQAEARKKAAAARKGRPEAPTGGFRGPEDTVRFSTPVAPPAVAEDDRRDRDRDRDRDDHDHGHDDDDDDDDDGKGKDKDGKGG